MKYYKYLSANGSSCNGGSAKWSLPENGKPGEWMPKVDVDPCNSGYHLCEEKDLLEWSGESLWLVEGRGTMVRSDNKTVFAESRLIKRLNWDERIARHFACDCAERVLHIFEKEFPKDTRVRDCIKTSRDFADGSVDSSALSAESAAWSALSAAWSAESAAWSAESAARSAASAAWSAEKKWQLKRLLDYATGKIKLKNIGVKP